MDVRVKFDDSMLNNGRVIRLFDRPDPFLRPCVQHIIAFFSRPERASDVTSGVAVESVDIDIEL